MRLATVVVRDRLPLVLFVVFTAVALTGCGTMSRMLKSASVDAPHAVPPPSPSPPATPVMAIAADPPTVAPDPSPDTALVDVPPGAETASGEVVDSGDVPIAPTSESDAGELPVLVAQAPAAPPPARGPRDRDEYDIEEYDPWEPFNETMFDFNRRLDRHIVKPVAQAYNKVVPDDVQRMIANGFDNLESIKRMVNSLLQRKWDGAVRELSRFLLNSTLGVGGLFDVAKAAEIEKSREDFGQTLGFYGVGPGPYLVLPLSAPSTVRDFIGGVLDGFLNPLRYILPGNSFFFDGLTDPADYVQDSWERIVIDTGELVNDRSLNLELFQGFEETVIDMYSAVRHAYLERRRNLIKE